MLDNGIFGHRRICCVWWHPLLCYQNCRIDRLECWLQKWPSWLLLRPRAVALDYIQWRSHVCIWRDDAARQDKRICIQRHNSRFPTAISLGSYFHPACWLHPFQRQSCMPFQHVLVCGWSAVISTWLVILIVSTWKAWIALLRIPSNAKVEERRYRIWSQRDASWA